MYGMERTVGPVVNDEDACVILQIKAQVTSDGGRVLAALDPPEHERAVLLQLDAAYLSYAERRLRGVQGPG